MKFNAYAALAAIVERAPEKPEIETPTVAIPAIPAIPDKPNSGNRGNSRSQDPEISKENGTAPGSITPSRVEPAPAKSDAEIYADALRIYGPSSYGALACVLGWGAGRSSAAETVLRKAGRIAYNRIGKGTLIE